MKSGCSLTISTQTSILIKYIAIVFVIVTHANGGGPNAFQGLPLLSDTPLLGILCEGGMALFLILSGYGICCSIESRGGVINYWYKRFVNVLFPAIIVQCGYFLAITLIARSYSQDGLIGSLLCLRAVNNLDGTMWYLSMLFFFYLLMYCCYLIFRNINVCGIAMFIIALIAFPLISGTWISAFYCILCFPIGVLYYFLSKKFKEIPVILSTIIIFIGYSLCIYLCGFHCRETEIGENIGATAFAIATILLFNMIDIKSVPEFFACSLFLYLLEMKTIIKPNVYEVNFIPKWVTFLILFFLTNVMAYTMMKLYDRFKNRFLKIT